MDTAAPGLMPQLDAHLAQIANAKAAAAEEARQAREATDRRNAEYFNQGTP